jgi:hypothetical protein
MNYLVFVDTNIFLDFYKVRGRESGLSILQHLDAHHDRIITTSQVEMEFKKNRQRVILESHDLLKVPNWAGLQPPVFLAESKQSKAITKNQKQIDSLSKTLRRRIGAVLRDPSHNDEVYKVLQRLFKNESPYNLSRDKKIRYSIRRMACKRFAMGYPPRKSNDTHVGDAINWEWIIHCASTSPHHIVIVTRDSDYGVVFDKHPTLNDWLAQEFKERVSRKRKLQLTDRLSEGLKVAGIGVTKAEERSEEELLEEIDHMARFRRAFLRGLPDRLSTGQPDDLLAFRNFLVHWRTPPIQPPAQEDETPDA